MKRFAIAALAAMISACASVPHSVVKPSWHPPVMADASVVPLSQLPNATAPLSCAEIVPLVQNGVTVKTPLSAVSPAATGDITKAACAAPTTVTGVNGQAVPASAPLVGTDASGHVVAVTVLPVAQEPAHTGDVTNSAGSLATTIAAGAVTDAKASLAVKPPVGLVAVANLSLTGAQTIDGQLGTAGTTLVLATAQSIASQNGPWIMQTGAWTRPAWYPSGGTTQAFQFIETLVRLGTTYQGSIWRQTAAAPITIDTTATTWVNTPLAPGNIGAGPFPSTVTNSNGNPIVGASSALLPGQVAVGAPAAATFTGAISGTTLTVSGVTGTIAIGAAVTNVGTSPVTAGTVITAGSGTTWTVNHSQTVSSEAMSSSTGNTVGGVSTLPSTVTVDCNVTICANFPGGTLADPTATIGLTAANGTAASSLRSDGAPALSQAIVPTWTALHTFNAGLATAAGVNFTGSTLTFTTGSTPCWICSATNVLTGQAATGVTPEVYVFQNNNDGVDTTTTGAGNLDEVFIRDVPGINHTGGRSSLWSEMDINHSPATAAGLAGYVGVQAQVTDNANLGGTDLLTNAAGNVFGGDSNTSLQSGATDVAFVTAWEFARTIATGASARSAYGIDIVAGGNLQGGSEDAAIGIHGAGQPFAVGLLFGGAVSSWSFGATSTLEGAVARTIGGSSSPIALNGTDWSAVTFQTGGCAFKSSSSVNTGGGLCVDPNGRFEPAVTSAHSWTTTGLFASVPGGIAVTDTTSTGTVTTEATMSFGGAQYNSTSATTFTNLATLYITPPTTTGNASATSTFGILSTGAIETLGQPLDSTGGLFVSGGNAVLNNNSNFVTNLGTGSTTALVTAGGGSNGVVINSNQLGSIKDTGLISTGTKFTAAGTGCTVGATVGGATAGTFTLATGPCTSVALTLNGATGLTAPNGWACEANDRTAPTVLIGGNSATTATTATITIPAGAGTSDVIGFHCVGY